MRNFLLVVLFGIFILSGVVIFYNAYGQFSAAATSTRARAIFQELNSTVAEPADFLQTAQAAQTTQTSTINFNEIRTAFNNDDIVAHLLIPNTSIDYLVVQAADNDFYLYNDIWQNRSNAGWIFFDYEVDLASVNQNWIIYGHNMQQDHKFHSLRRFLDYDFFRQNSIITLTTETGITHWQIFAAYSSDISFAYNTVNFDSPEQRNFLLNSFAENSVFSTNFADNVVDFSQPILTLSTCTNITQDTRFVVHAVLITKGEVYEEETIN
ncbi:MAG: class B sortase [Defluviitaleaceae bacterium]|nr:class B sortase [Defluviitaleaceae bacterium]